MASRPTAKRLGMEELSPEDKSRWRSHGETEETAEGSTDAPPKSP